MSSFDDLPAKLVNNVAELIHYLPHDRPEDPDCLHALAQLRSQLYELQGDLDDSVHNDLVTAVIEAVERTLA